MTCAKKRDPTAAAISASATTTAQGPQHMQHHAPHARLRSGETQHIVIVKANGMIKRDLLQGFE